jgi:hypothetical protein
MNEATNSTSRFTKPQNEPLFIAIPQHVAEFQTAYDRAAATIPHSIEQIQRAGDSFCSAKLRFRDPDESDRLEEDRFLFLCQHGVAAAQVAA